MTDDLISRQAALSMLSTDLDKIPMVNNSVNDMIRRDERIMCIDTIKALPPAEPQRKKGNWVGIDDEPCETFECDVCGFVLEDWIIGACYNFCPNCGSYMGGAEDEQ